MTMEELLKHFSEEVMVRVKLAGTFDELGEVSEHDMVLWHDFNGFLPSVYDNAEVVSWFYAKYTGECDELVAWVKDGYMQEV